MKVAIISDTHDNVPNLEKAIKWMNDNKIDRIIHCGDLCAPSILINVLAKEFKGPIDMVFGNVEDRDLLPEVVKKFKNVTHHGDLGELDINGKKVAFIHYPDKAKKLAQSGKYNYVFYGHTHKPWEEDINGCKLLNPGTCAGLFSKATFAVWDVDKDKFELKILEQL